MEVTHLLIRADASVQIGSGHVMRCLALAQAWQDHGGAVTFLCSHDLPSALRERLQAESMSVETLDAEPGSRADADQAIHRAQAHAVKAVVVDGYHFGAAYQRWLKSAGLRVLFIDDNGHAEHYYADWVLNQNIHADESLYDNREPYTGLLLGPDYVLLRREFWAWRGREKPIAETGRHILVTMGGSDPDNVTRTVLEAIAQLPDAGQLDVRAVVGGANPHLDDLRRFADTAPVKIELLHNVQNMPELMAWADLAVSAGGSTVWELCLMGVPAVLIVTADNQTKIASKLDALNASLSLGPVSKIDLDMTGNRLSTLLSSSDVRHTMKSRAQCLVNAERHLNFKNFIRELQDNANHILRK